MAFDASSRTPARRMTAAIIIFALAPTIALSPSAAPTITPTPPALSPAPTATRAPSHAPTTRHPFWAPFDARDAPTPAPTLELTPAPSAFANSSAAPTAGLGCAPKWLGVCRVSTARGEDVDGECCAREEVASCAEGFRYDRDQASKSCGKVRCARQTCCVYCLPGQPCPRHSDKYGDDARCSDIVGFVLLVVVLMIGLCFCAFAFGCTVATSSWRRPPGHRVALEQVLVGDPAPRPVVVEGRGLDSEVEMAGAVVVADDDARDEAPVARATFVPAAAHVVKIS
ncbi:hypothetical protein JL720_3419 [Aureococcus anophagefferens]|nr:hypothetical protein JL720_3419 [Aureococcus anophagefferens]